MPEEREGRESRTERMDSFWDSFAQRRRDRIRKSLLRPLYQEVLKNLFLTLVILVDVLLPLQAFKSFPLPVNIITALVALCVLLFIEMRVWNAVWGASGRWALAKYEKEQTK